MSAAVIPEPIAQLQRQLDQIRSTQPRGKKLPDSVWQAAVELAREHGVYSVAHPLRLDYMGLKKRLGGVSHGRRKARKPAFVELIWCWGKGGRWPVWHGPRPRVIWAVATATLAGTPKSAVVMSASSPTTRDF